MASTDLPASLVKQIARNVLGVADAAIPSEVVEHTKALILDSIGCALAAIEEPAFARASRVFAQLDSHAVHRHRTFLLLEPNAYSDQKLPHQLGTDEPTRVYGSNWNRLPGGFPASYFSSFTRGTETLLQTF
jgi:hypothetical protein